MPKIIKRSSPCENVGQYCLQDSLEEQVKQLEQIKRSSSRVHEVQKTREETAIETAFMQAEGILEVARTEGEKIKEEARKEGYDAGQKTGHEEGYRQAYHENVRKLEEDREAVLAEVEETITDMQAEKQKLLDKYINDLKDISIAVAEKVMQISLKTSGDIIKRMIISATEKLKKTEWAKIYISRYDAELMTEGDAQLLNALAYLSDNIKIIAMDKEESGTCIVELPKEIIDISINTQLENIKDILNNAQL